FLSSLMSCSRPIPSRSSSMLITLPRATGSLPNAGAHLLPEAGAKRTLEAVRCSPMLGAARGPFVLPAPQSFQFRIRFVKFLHLLLCHSLELRGKMTDHIRMVLFSEFPIGSRCLFLGAGPAQAENRVTVRYWLRLRGAWRWWWGLL